MSTTTTIPEIDCNVQRCGIQEPTPEDLAAQIETTTTTAVPWEPPTTLPHTGGEADLAAFALIGFIAGFAMVRISRRDR